MNASPLQMIEVAELCGTGSRELQRWLHGDVDPSRATKCRVLATIGVSASEELLTPVTDTKSGASRLYYIVSPSACAAKIGISYRPKRRFFEINQCDARGDLIMAYTELGARAREEGLHRKLRAFRLHSEWFAICDEMLALLDPEPRAAIQSALAGAVV